MKNMRTSRWLVLMVGICLSVQSLSAVDIKRYVKVGGTGNGTSWENACGSIQQAVENCKVAGSGTVYIAEGVYYECVTFPLHTNNVKLLGSFPKDGGDKQDYMGTPSIIDGRNQPYCMQVKHCQDVTIDGILMRGGHTGSIPLNKLEPNHAGGLEMNYASGVISNCTFIDNNKYGLEIHEGVTVKDCIIGKNAGGVYCDDAYISNSYIVQNNGSGVMLSGGTVSNSKIYENKGVGVYAYGGKILFCNIYNNQNTSKPGGGISSQGVTNVYGCCIYNNTASKGAGIYSGTSSILVESTTIVNNKANEGGAGIHFENTWHSLAALILWNNQTLGKSAQFRFENTDKKSNMHHCAIQGGGELPETDELLGIINLASANKADGKPSPCFKNVYSRVGASLTNSEMIQEQDFDLELGSACIGTGALAKQLEWHKNNDLSDRGINGQKHNKNHFNCGAYQETSEKYSERMGTVSTQKENSINEETNSTSIVKQEEKADISEEDNKQSYAVEETVAEEEIVDDNDSTDEVFKMVEVAPQFPGGIQQMHSYLQKNIVYPKVAQNKKIEGKVIVQCIIDKNGNVKDAKVIRSVDPYLDREALRVIQMMPKWKPGEQRGKRVNCEFTIPVTFKLK